MWTSVLTIMDQPYQGSAIDWLLKFCCTLSHCVPAMMMYRPCTGRDHTLYNGILIGIAFKELMVCDVDHHYLRLVILCKTGGGDMCK